MSERDEMLHNTQFNQQDQLSGPGAIGRQADNRFYREKAAFDAEAAELTRLRAIEAAAREVAKAVPFGCDRIRELAFDLPAPNEKTPQLMGIAIELTRLAEKLRLALSGGEGK